MIIIYLPSSPGPSINNLEIVYLCVDAITTTGLAMEPPPPPPPPGINVYDDHVVPPPPPGIGIDSEERSAMEVDHDGEYKMNEGERQEQMLADRAKKWQKTNAKRFGENKDF